MKNRVIYYAVIAALGGLLFGFDTAVISGTTDWLSLKFDLSSFWLGFTVASALIGTIIGSIMIGGPADKYGRKNVLFVIALLYLISAVGSAIAWNWYIFIIARFLGGLAVGGASVVSPMYTAEISPPDKRGRLVAITQFNIVLGILLAFFSNYLISGLQLGDIEWRVMFGVEVLPALIFFGLLFLTPESPRWLISKNRIDEAKSVLTECGVKNSILEIEVEKIKGTLESELKNKKIPFYSRVYIKPIMLAISIALFNQLSGINAVMYYAPHIFKMAGAESQSAFLQTVVIGGTNLIFTMLALLVIDRFGRKKLMLWGSVGYIISLSAIAVTFYTQGINFSDTGSVIILLGLVIFIASHAFGQGAVIWVYLSEIFPNSVRARGQALGSFTHWFMAALISWTFPIIAEISGGHAFAFYTVCMVGQLFWVIYIMIETKGISLEDIQKKLGIN